MSNSRRILVIGKYPPILGGVSTHTYFTCCALARNGHQVFVLTNRLEAEPTLSQQLPEDTPVSLNPKVIDIAGIKEFSYVPWASPNLSRLIGAALRIIREERIELIVGWYLEPYGLAASIAGRSTGVPYLLRHAGSDLGKLSLNADLCEAYRFAVSGASAVISAGRSSDVLEKLTKELAVDPRKIVSLHPCRLPSVYRRIKKGPRKLDDLIAFATAREPWFQGLSLTDQEKQWLRNSARSNLDIRRPTLAIYGKVGEIKGTWDLLTVLESLAQSVDFNLICLSGGKPQEYLTLVRTLVGSPFLSKRTAVIPPCPPWEVTNILAQTDAVCCLERKFPVEFHAPRLPREVLAAGVCLVISSEIANKQPFRSSLVDQKNCFIVPDPCDHEALENTLGSLLNNADHVRVVAKHGFYLSQTIEELMIGEDSMACAINDIANELCLPPPPQECVDS